MRASEPRLLGAPRRHPDGRARAGHRARRSRAVRSPRREPHSPACRPRPPHRRWPGRADLPRVTVVTAIDGDDIRSLFVIRRALEETATRLAATSPRAPEFAALAAAFDEVHLDREDARDDYYRLIAEFDAALDSAAANDYLTAALRTVRTHLVRVRRLARHQPDRLSASVAEHRLIAAAIAAVTPTSPPTPPTCTCTTPSRASSSPSTTSRPARPKGPRMTITHHLRVPPQRREPRARGQLAWALARLAVDPVAVDDDVVDMIINRVIDNAAVAAASLTRRPVSAARQQALDHAVSIGGVGATVFGCALERRSSPEWAAWANGVAVRELDYHDTFLAADYSHPATTFRPCWRCPAHPTRRRRRGARLATAYEVQIDLVRPSRCTSTRSTTSPTSVPRPPPASEPC